MKTSCGVIILKNNHILLGHATGQSHWDIPKGMLEDNEDPKACAVREVMEETSIDLSNEILEDLGVFKYNKAKQLYLFRTDIKQAIIVENLVCTSFFEHIYTKKMTPEVDDFGFFTKEEAQLKTTKNLFNVISDLFHKENTLKI